MTTGTFRAIINSTSGGNNGIVPAMQIHHYPNNQPLTLLFKS